MKKLALSIVACLFGVFAMATETTYFQIYINSNSGTNDRVRVSEDDAYTNDYEDGADADKMMSLSNSKSVLLFAQVGTHDCGTVVAANLDGMYLGFTTNMIDNDYTLTFSNFTVGSREVKLYDAVADSLITLNSSTPAYAFTATPGRIEVRDRFMFGDAPVIPFEICHRYGKLQVSGYKGGTVVVKDNTDTPVINVVVPTRTQYSIDLSALTAGQYKVEYNDGTAKTVIIDVK